ncbi:hypothetical protein D3C75_1013060 [compost metagenome]
MKQQGLKRNILFLTAPLGVIQVRKNIDQQQLGQQCVRDSVQDWHRNQQYRFCYGRLSLDNGQNIKNRRPQERPVHHISQQEAAWILAFIEAQEGDLQEQKDIGNRPVPDP